MTDPRQLTCWRTCARPADDKPDPYRRPQPGNSTTALFPPVQMTVPPASVQYME